MNMSFGYIETRGLIGAIEAADAMVKAAKVRLLKTRKVGAALVTVIVEGELSACQAAVDAGTAAAARIGELISAHVIPNPYSDTELFTRGLEEEPEQDVPVNTAGHQEKKREIRKKHAGGAKRKTESKKRQSPADLVAGLIKKAFSKGISLAEITELTGMPEKEIRLIIKDLLDKEKIERVQHKYYWIESP